jgi:hypothetical protein
MPAIDRGAFGDVVISRKRLTSLLQILPFAVLLAHASVLGTWINDDAGITFSYARNLALGNGLVSQPGAEPVEGYSNFLWVLLFAPFFVFTYSIRSGAKASGPYEPRSDASPEPHAQP